MVTFGWAAWKSVATFWNAVLPGSVEALCHHVSVTSVPPLSWPPAAEDAGALAVVAGPLLADAVAAGVAAVELAGAAVFLELEHAEIARAATAAMAVALASWRGKRLVRLVMNVPSARVPHSIRVPGGGVRPSPVVPKVTENVTIVPTAALR